MLKIELSGSSFLLILSLSSPLSNLIIMDSFPHYFVCERNEFIKVIKLNLSKIVTSVSFSC